MNKTKTEKNDEEEEKAGSYLTKQLLQYFPVGDSRHYW